MVEDGEQQIRVEVNKIKAYSLKIIIKSMSGTRGGYIKRVNIG